MKPALWPSSEEIPLNSVPACGEDSARSIPPSSPHKIAVADKPISRMVVHAPDKSIGHRVQRIDVHYTFIGEIDLSPEYSKYEKETAA